MINLLKDSQLQELDTDQWIELPAEHPEYAEKCDWKKLNSRDWAALFRVSPQRFRTGIPV